MFATFTFLIIIKNSTWILNYLLSSTLWGFVESRVFFLLNIGKQQFTVFLEDFFDFLASSPDDVPFKLPFLASSPDEMPFNIPFLASSSTASFSSEASERNSLNFFLGDKKGEGFWNGGNCTLLIRVLLSRDVVGLIGLMTTWLFGVEPPNGV